MVRVIFVFLACVHLHPIKSQDIQHRSRQLQFYSSYNEPCATSNDCRPLGYVCKKNKTCDCDRMYVLDSYKTQCVGGVDQKCVYDEHCIHGAFCMNQAICRCKESTPVVLEDGMVCARSSVMRMYERIWVLLSLVIQLLM